MNLLAASFPPLLEFAIQVFLLGLLGWYLYTEIEKIKRALGSILTVLFTAVCIYVCYPPFDVKDADGKIVKEGAIPLGLDLKGGTSFLIQLKPEKDDKGETKIITPHTLDTAVETIRKRVDKLGTSEPVIAKTGTDRILVQIPGLPQEKLAYTEDQLKKVAKLDFKLVHPNSDAISRGEMPPDPRYEFKDHIIYKHEKPRADGTKPKDEERTVERVEKLYIKKKADVPGSMVVSASPTIDQRGWGVSLTFNSEGTDLFGKLTQANVNNRFAIVLDGVIQSAPVINEPILGGTASITGSFTQEEAAGLSSVLENPLETPVEIAEKRSASASLGDDAIKSGSKSGLFGVIATVVGVLLYYRFVGLIATIALAVNSIILFGAMALTGSVLTLPGIAGLILTLGMAIDANVLIYERLREEMEVGRTLKGSVAGAFDKAFSAIFDSNFTTLITAVILFIYATGPVKGFAVTLTIGIIASMFSALIVTRNLLDWAVHLGILKEVKMTNLIKATNYDFLGKRKAAIIASLVIIGGSIGIFAIRGAANFGVDFRGGDRVVMVAEGAKSELSAVRGVVERIKGAADISVSVEKTAEKEFFILRTPKEEGNGFAAKLSAEIPDAKFKVEQVETVGALVGGELARSSIIALVLGMVGILIYVSMRFEVSFALGAIVALLHDVIITIGVFSLLGRELSLSIVGAILTIAGYSVNDTIVVFDRIREGLDAGRRGTVSEIMNASINETLSRTILTGGVTLMTTIILFIFGGPVLNDFALTILIGVLIGTYSSVFIAAPIVLWWSSRKGGDLRVEVESTRNIGREATE